MNTEELRAALEDAGVRWEVGAPLRDGLREQLGYVPGPDEPSLNEQVALGARMLGDGFALGGSTGVAHPSDHDLRNVGGRNFVTRVKDQGPCLSCVAFGAAAAVEGTLRVQQDDPALDVDLSEAHLFYNVARAQGRRCTNPDGGWWPAAALDAFQSDGVPDEACYEYTSGDQDGSARCADWARRATRITGWVALASPADTKAWIASRGPVVGSMMVYEDLQLYGGGVYRRTAGAERGGHCVCLVGYDDLQQFWIAKNSWGDGWGEAGFLRIAYGECGIDAGAWGVEGVIPPS
jgi:C1A family cysteine protease